MKTLGEFNYYVWSGKTPAERNARFAEAPPKHRRNVMIHVKSLDALIKGRQNENR